VAVVTKPARVWLNGVELKGLRTVTVDRFGGQWIAHFEVEQACRSTTSHRSSRALPHGAARLREFQVGQIAQRLGLVQFVDVDTLT
jgi:hypothetical protein